MTTSSREEEIRQDIERTREQLGDTVEALAHKVDVPARAKETVHVKAEEVTQHVLEGTGAVQAKVAELSQDAEQLIDQGLDQLPLLAAAVAVVVVWVLRRLLRRHR